MLKGQTQRKTRTLLFPDNSWSFLSCALSLSLSHFRANPQESFFRHFNYFRLAGLRGGHPLSISSHKFFPSLSLSLSLSLSISLYLSLSLSLSVSLSLPPSLPPSLSLFLFFFLSFSFFFFSLSLSLSLLCLSLSLSLSPSLASTLQNWAPQRTCHFMSALWVVDLR